MTGLSTAALITLLTQAPTGQPETPDPRLLRQPAIHGDTVVFAWAGDLWVAKTGGGVARRLTSSPGLEQYPRISPDGKSVAFTGMYEGNPDVYVVPLEGGEPKRLTYEPEADLVASWTPDGKIAYASNAGNFINRQQRLWLVDPQGGLPVRTPIAEASVAVSYFPGEDKIVWNRRSSFQFNWRRYRGGTQGIISIYDFKTNTYQELPHGREQNYFPMAAKGAIYYVSDKNQATLNLYRYDPKTKRTTQLTRFTDADIRYPSTDGESIVYERDGLLYRYDLDSNEIQTLRPDIRGENLQARPYLRDLSRDIANLTISPSGVRVAVEARGEVFTLPAKQGDVRNLTQTSGAREQMPQWSPDGQSLAYVSDESGEKAVYVRPQLGGEATRLTTERLALAGIEWSPDSKKMALVTTDGSLRILDVGTKALTLVVQPSYGIGGWDWSPDSRQLAYSSAGRNRFNALYVYDVATGKRSQLTSGRYDDRNPAWDLNGNYLFFVSSRTFRPSFGQYEFSLKVEDADRVYAIPLRRDMENPLVPKSDEEPVKTPPPPAPPTPPAGAPAAAPAQPAAPPTPPGIRVDAEGAEGRAFVLPWPASSYGGLTGVRDGVIVNTGGTLVQFTFGDRQSTPLVSNVFGAYAVNPSRTKLAAYVGGLLSVVDLRPGAQLPQGRVDTAGLETMVYPREEWNQMYWETWRYMRDEYYDPGLRGLDWKAIGDRYAKYLPYVSNRMDLNYVIGQLIGELGTGHAYVSGGETPAGGRPVAVGQLGADYEVSGDRIRFRKIYRGENFEEGRRGPLGDPGVDVREGDYLLAIDGRPVNANTPPGSLLLGKAGRVVTLTVNSTPSMEGARQERVRPIASEANLRYVDFVEENRRKVDRLSNGRIGYMHIPNTAFEGSVELIRGFYSQTDKDALLVDERWNGGGYIQPWFVDTLARRRRAFIQPRHGADWEDAVAIEGPKALLINAYAGSGGDFFPYMFRQSKVGPLIGTRTWGGLVGINSGLQLVDGGTVNAPAFAIYDRETFDIVAENTGVDPDIEVDARPDEWAKGRDAQLEAGVKYLLDQLAKLPPAKTRTKVPQVGPKGRIGDD